MHCVFLVELNVWIVASVEHDKEPAPSYVDMNTSDIYSLIT